MHHTNYSTRLYRTHAVLTKNNMIMKPTNLAMTDCSSSTQQNQQQQHPLVISSSSSSSSTQSMPTKNVGTKRQRKWHGNLDLVYGARTNQTYLVTQDDNLVPLPMDVCVLIKVLFRYLERVDEYALDLAQAVSSPPPIAKFAERFVHVHFLTLVKIRK